MSETVPTAVTLYNYDTNHHSFPGLLLQRGGGATTIDSTKYQEWSYGLLPSRVRRGDPPPSVALCGCLLPLESEERERATFA